MTVTEPATLATDYLMATLAVLWAKNLWGQRKTSWSKAFAALAAASFIGGTYHGFQNAMQEPVKWAFWQTTMVFSSLSSMFMLFAGTRQFGRSGSAGNWRQVGLIKFLVCLGVGAVWPVFLVVLVDFVLTMLVIAALAVTKLSTQRKASTQYLSGVGLFIIGGLVQALHLAPHPSFNHNDLFHVIQIVANGMFYLVARRGNQES